MSVKLVPQQIPDMTTEQLGVFDSLNTEEDAVEQRTNAEKPGEAEAFTSSGNGANPGQVLSAGCVTNFQVL